MTEEYEMKPVILNKMLFENRKAKVDPAFRVLTEGLRAQIEGILRDPNRLSISCCIEGCCVSWCCIRIS
jgi:hypothetical protein